jgi:putative endonuclease
VSTRSAGQEAERRAAQFLEALGYKIRHRNYACRLGELDLVCEEGEVLCFVEVRMRTRSRLGEAIETIDGAKRRRIALAARHYLTRFQLDERACRFDVVTISGGDEPELIRDAFTDSWRL